MHTFSEYKKSSIHVLFIVMYLTCAALHHFGFRSRLASTCKRRRVVPRAALLLPVRLSLL